MGRAPSTPTRMVATVLVTCVVAAAALAGTYMLTRERIIEQERAAEVAALKSVLPDAAEFVQAEELLDEAVVAAGDVTLSAVYRATDTSGDPAGWGVRVAPRGYAGPIQLIVGLDRDGLVTGVSIITMNETPGLGTKIVTEPGWMDQFTGWDGSDIDTAAKQFDGIAGATKSAVAIRNGVTAAGSAFAEVLSQASEEVQAQ